MKLPANLEACLERLKYRVSCRSRMATPIMGKDLLQRINYGVHDICYREKILNTKTGIAPLLNVGIGRRNRSHSAHINPLQSALKGRILLLKTISASEEFD